MHDIPWDVRDFAGPQDPLFPIHPLFRCTFLNVNQLFQMRVTVELLRSVRWNVDLDEHDPLSIRQAGTA